MACKCPHNNDAFPEYRAHPQYTTGDDLTIKAVKITNIIHHANGGATVETDEAKCATCGKNHSQFLHKKWMTPEQKKNLAIGSYLAEYTNSHTRTLMRALMTPQELHAKYTRIEEGGDHA
jgi:hypothetical protein